MTWWKGLGVVDAENYNTLFAQVAATDTLFTGVELIHFFAIKLLVSVFSAEAAKIFYFVLIWLICIPVKARAIVRAGSLAGVGIMPAALLFALVWAPLHEATQIRAAIAVLFVILACQQYIEKGEVSLRWLVLAAVFHYSGAIIGILWLARKISPIVMVLIIGMSAMVILPFVVEFLPIRYGSYMESDVTTRMINLQVLGWGTLGLAQVVAGRRVNNESCVRAGTLLLCGVVLFYSFSTIPALAFRMAELFWVSSVVGVQYFMKAFRVGLSRLAVGIAISFFAAGLFVETLSKIQG